MRALLITLFASLSCIAAFAHTESCPATNKKQFPLDQTVFFYKYTKAQQHFYVPIAQSTNGKIKDATHLMVPANMVLFDLNTNQPVHLHFKNALDNVGECISIGETQTAASKGVLFANKKLANSFNFQPSAADVSLFATNIPNPCLSGATYDKNGIASCNADTLIASSQMSGSTLYWHTKQYRHDVGVAISEWHKKNKTFHTLIENCSLCAD